MSHNKIWLYSNRKIISCPVASVLYGEGKEEGRRKKEEGRRKKKRKNLKYGKYSPNFYTNDTSGHDITSSEYESLNPFLILTPDSVLLTQSSSAQRLLPAHLNHFWLDRAISGESNHFLDIVR